MSAHHLYQVRLIVQLSECIIYTLHLARAFSGGSKGGARETAPGPYRH